MASEPVDGFQKTGQTLGAFGRRLEGTEVCGQSPHERKGVLFTVGDHGSGSGELVPLGKVRRQAKHGLILGSDQRFLLGRASLATQSEGGKLEHVPNGRDSS